jgi:6,7-dimethyl-8-ribityllumazine synthase
MASLKGPGEAQQHDGSALRIGIVHARWNTSTSLNHPTTRTIIADTVYCKAIIEPLLDGTKAKLLESGVKESNIVIQSVPGSWELPIACSK